MNTYAEIIGFFVKRKKKMGWGPASEYWWSGNNYKVPECTMSAWYEEAKRLYDLGGHYDTFRDCVENEIYYDREAYRRSRRAIWYYRQTGGRYAKKPHHKKKELSEDELRKREWRKKVKDPRDQGTRFYHDGEHKKFVCKVGNKAERRFIKMKLKSSSWEKYHDLIEECYRYPEESWDNWLSRKKREWVNPWDWD